jgi:hypothetical protein
MLLVTTAVALTALMCPNVWLLAMSPPTGPAFLPSLVGAPLSLALGASAITPIPDVKKSLGTIAAMYSNLMCQVVKDVLDAAFCNQHGVYDVPKDGIRSHAWGQRHKETAAKKHA